MKNSFLKTVTNSIKYWYVPLIVGLILIAVGVYTLSRPVETYLSLSIIFSVAFIVAGFSEIIFSISNREEMEGWGWNLAFGILTLLTGILLITKPEISVATLPFYVGFLILSRSMMGVSYALELKNYMVLDWGNLMLISVLGIIFSFILLWNPLFAGLSIVAWTALSFITAGIFSVYLSFKLKKINSMPENVSQELKDRFNQLKDEMASELEKIRTKQ